MPVKEKFRANLKEVIGEGYKDQISNLKIHYFDNESYFLTVFELLVQFLPKAY